MPLPREEILAKRARLLEVKRQRELREKELDKPRQSVAVHEELIAPTPSREGHRRDIDDLITNLVGSRPSSAASREAGAASPAAKGSRPSSVLSPGGLSVEIAATPLTGATRATQAPPASISSQTLSTTLNTIYDYAPAPVPEVLTYSKGIQTTDLWSQQSRDHFSDSDDGDSPSKFRTPRKIKRLSRRERERDEELRQNLRKEIEEELKALKESGIDGNASAAAQQKSPGRLLTDEELKAVTSSDDFVGFVERSSKVIERALDQDYDVLANYASGGPGGVEDDDEEYGNGPCRKGRRIRELAQFWDGRWSKKRMISDISFSPKFPELVLASYTKNPTAPHDPDGLVQIWNFHLHDRPEYVFHAQSDVLTARFSPFHPNLIVGGAYSGQVLLWDTRAKSASVQRTALTGSGHTHPVYSVDIVGTQHANNVISCSTDGVVCGWAIDMLSQPQEYLELKTPHPTKTEDLSPTCMAFPHADPTYFLVGTEEGTIYPCHRYDRAGAKAGVDQRLSYRGHAAPVMSVAFHPARGPVDLGDLVLSSSLDWSVKLWKVRAPAAMSATAVPGSATVVAPLLDITREDVVYAAAWSPVKPGVFALVDGAGSLEVWDITVDTEVPLAKTQPSSRKAAGFHTKSLNKVAWEENGGRKVAVGGLDGVVSVFEVGSELGGQDGVQQEEWTGVKKLMARLDAGAGVDF